MPGRFSARGSSFRGSFELIAEPPYCADVVGAFRVLFDLFPEVADMYIHDARIPVIMEVPDTIQKLVTAQDLAFMIRQIQQEFEFLRCEDEQFPFIINIIFIQMYFRSEEHT